jgi:hypothetical protein
MMARRRRDGLVAPLGRWPAAVSELGGARRSALEAELGAVSEALAYDPDSAALLLDGLLRRIAAEWFLSRGRMVPAAEELLGRLGDEAAPFAQWLRLALRAPDVRARLVAAGQCLREM